MFPPAAQLPEYSGFVGVMPSQASEIHYHLPLRSEISDRRVWTAEEHLRVAVAAAVLQLPAARSSSLREAPRRVQGRRVRRRRPGTQAIERAPRSPDSLLD
jgi:hypothetical protein